MNKELHSIILMIISLYIIYIIIKDTKHYTPKYMGMMVIYASVPLYFINYYLIENIENNIGYKYIYIYYILLFFMMYKAYKHKKNKKNNLDTHNKDTQQKNVQ